MIEIPRAALVAEASPKRRFFSFGTNDLTQMTIGFSRDDAGSFLPRYIENGIFEHDPFRAIDQKGVGQLVGGGRSRRAARLDPTSRSGSAASTAATRRRSASSIGSGSTT